MDWIPVKMTMALVAHDRYYTVEYVVAISLKDNGRYEAEGGFTVAAWPAMEVLTVDLSSGLVSYTVHYYPSSTERINRKTGKVRVSEVKALVPSCALNWDAKRWKDTVPFLTMSKKEESEILLGPGMESIKL